jgi:hypothetical protein
MFFEYSKICKLIISVVTVVSTLRSTLWVLAWLQLHKLAISLGYKQITDELLMDLTEGVMARQLLDKFKLCWYMYVAIHVII